MKSHRQLTPNTFEEVDVVEEAVTDILDVEKPFPAAKVGRVALILAIAHTAFLVFAFTTIVVIRYALGA